MPHKIQSEQTTSSQQETNYAIGITELIEAQNIRGAYHKVLELNHLLDEQEFHYALPLIQYLLNTRKHKANYAKTLEDLHLGLELFDNIKFLNNSKLIRNYLLFCTALNVMPNTLQILASSFQNIKNNQKYTEESLANIVKMLEFSRNDAELALSTEEIVTTYFDVFEEHKDKINLKITLNHAKNIPKNKSKKPKVALCISGQLREYTSVHESTIKFIANEYDADIFIHTWDNSGNRLPKPTRAGYCQIFPENFYAVIEKHQLLGQRLFERYPSLKAAILYGDKINKRAIKQCYGENTTVIIEKESDMADIFTKLSRKPGWAKHPNQAKMYYKIYACNELKKKKEEEQGFLYDVVIRFRADQPLEAPFSLESIYDVIYDDNVIYSDGVFAYGYGDIFAYGSSKAIDHYSSIWLNVEKFSELDTLPAFRFPVVPHNILFDYLFYSEFKVRHAPHYKVLPLARGKINKTKIVNSIEHDRQNELDDIDREIITTLQEHTETEL